MATTIITGKDLTLTIDGDSFSDASSSVVLELVNEQSEFDVLSGTAYKTLKTTGTLTCTLFQDWGATPSLCEALWNAANTAPDTSLPFSFVANGATFTGDVFPNFVAAGGESPNELTATVVMVVEGGAVTLA
jgi:hypothetical protein